MNHINHGRTCARWLVRTAKSDAARLRCRQQEAPSHLSRRGARGSRLHHQRMRAGRRSGGLLDAQQPDLLVLGVSVDGIEVGKFLETLVRKELRRQGSRHRAAGVDHGKGRQANWRRIRHRDAAVAADAIQRRDAARQRRDAAAGRAGAKPGGGCRRGAEGRLARIVVSAEDRRPHPGSLRRRGAGADAASRLGRGAAGLLHPGRAAIRIFARCPNS